MPAGTRARPPFFWCDERGLEEVAIGVVASLIVLIGALVFIRIGSDAEAGS